MNGAAVPRTGNFALATPALLIDDQVDVIVGDTLPNLATSYSSDEDKKREYTERESRSTTFRGLPVYTEHNDHWEQPVGLTVGYRVVAANPRTGERARVETVHILNREPARAPAIGTSPDQQAITATRLQRCRLMTGVDRGLSLGHRFWTDYGENRASIMKRSVEISICKRGKRDGSVIQHYFPCRQSLEKSDCALVREFCQLYGYQQPSADAGSYGSESWGKFIGSLSEQVSARRASVLSRPGYQDLLGDLPSHAGVVRSSAAFGEAAAGVAAGDLVALDSLVSALFGNAASITATVAPADAPRLAPTEPAALPAIPLSSTMSATTPTNGAIGTPAPQSAATSSATGMALDAPVTGGAGGGATPTPATIAPGGAAASSSSSAGVVVPQFAGIDAATQKQIDDIASVSNDSFAAFQAAKARAEQLEQQNQALQQQMSQFTAERERAANEDNERKRSRTEFVRKDFQSAMHAAMEQCRDAGVLTPSQLEGLAKHMKTANEKADAAKDEFEIHDIAKNFGPSMEIAVTCSEQGKRSRIEQQHSEAMQRRAQIGEFFSRQPSVGGAAPPFSISGGTGASPFGAPSSAPSWGVNQASAASSSSLSGSRPQPAGLFQQPPPQNMAPPQQQQQSAPIFTFGSRQAPAASTNGAAQHAATAAAPIFSFGTHQASAGGAPTYPAHQQQHHHQPAAPAVQFDLAAPNLCQQVIDAHIAATGRYPSADEIAHGGSHIETRVVNSFNGQSYEEKIAVPNYQHQIISRDMMTPASMTPEIIAELVADVCAQLDGGDRCVSHEDMRSMHTIGQAGLVPQRFEPQASDGWNTPIQQLKNAMYGMSAY